MINRFQRYLKSLPARIVGSHVQTQSEHVTRLSSWAQFPADSKLEARLRAARDLIGPVSIKPDRKLIESQPDTFVKPIDFDELPS